MTRKPSSRSQASTCARILGERPSAVPWRRRDRHVGWRRREGSRHVLAWLRLDGLRVMRCHLRDPSWFQWPLLEAAIENNIVADFPLCNKSFNCSYSGHDL